ncbi:HAD-IC family P-type ATPase [Cellulomonas soli]
MLEQLARIRTAAFDKTGTMTHGRPRVEAVELLGSDLGVDDVLRFAAAAEQYSSHVLAQAVVDAALARDLPVPTAGDVQEVTAGGVTAVVDGRTVVVGKAAFVASATGREIEHGDVTPGRMTVHVGVDDRPAARLVLADEVRADARVTLERLRALGVRHEVMLTGDAEPTARHVGDLLGVADVRAGLLPADKVKAVAGLPDRPVMMIGDGVNDAPVLAAADVGVAMGAKGSTAASESADVVVMLDDIGRVARAVAIARRTVRVALQAIGLGIALSVVLMVVAAFGLIPAVVGATLQELVDLVAILGALRAVRPGPDELAVVGRATPRATAPQVPAGHRPADVAPRVTAAAVGGPGGTVERPARAADPGRTFDDE